MPGKCCGCQKVVLDKERSRCDGCSQEAHFVCLVWPGRGEMQCGACRRASTASRESLAAGSGIPMGLSSTMVPADEVTRKLMEENEQLKQRLAILEPERGERSKAKPNGRESTAGRTRWQKPVPPSMTKSRTMGKVDA